jgi:phage terminase large subunit
VARLVNPNLKFLCQEYNRGQRGVILEGSSRSGKTWSAIDFIVWLASKKETGATVNIIKETYKSFKTTLYDDFNRRLPMYGIASPFRDRQEVATFKLFGNKINLLGADSESVAHGVSCDYFYINEALDVSKGIFDQSEMRCRKFWFMDYNPKFTDHWIFDNVQPRHDVSFLKTTFRDNPFVSQAERTKIESYEPNEKNIQQGTADEYMWNVYGLGLRSAPEGLIFQHVTYIDKFPTDVDPVYYGIDFGFTQSPTAIVKLATKGVNLFAECLHYGPTPSGSNEIVPLLKNLVGKKPIWADSAEPGIISDCSQAGLKVFAAAKYPGSIKHGLTTLKKYKLHFVDHPAIRKEQSNYKYREIHGIKLDEPIDDFNHFFDALRYAAISNLK